MIASRLKELRLKGGITLEELARRVGTSKQTIHRYENGIISNIPPEKVVALADALACTPGDLMGWRDDAPTVKKLPLLGRIACGTPIFADEERDGYVLADGHSDADFCLRAAGDSMTGARIFDGDIVFIRAQESVDNGEIAAVIIGDEATLKRVYYNPDEQKLVLMPENPRYSPLVYVNDELAEIKILGKAVAFMSRVL